MAGVQITGRALDEQYERLFRDLRGLKAGHFCIAFTIDDMHGLNWTVTHMGHVRR